MRRKNVPISVVEYFNENNVIVDKMQDTRTESIPRNIVAFFLYTSKFFGLNGIFQYLGNLATKYRASNKIKFTPEATHN